jgi:hypothetical protein
MSDRIKKAGAIVGTLGAAFASGVVFASSSSATEPSAIEDCYAHGSPLVCYDGATTVTANSITNLVFTVGGLTDTCTHSSSTGKPPSQGLGKVNATPPVFDDGGGAPCTDNTGQTDTTTTKGKWQTQGKDNDGSAGENATEPNSGDKVKIFVPIDGAVVHNSAGCVITVNPDSTLDPQDNYTKPFVVTAAYDDKSIFKVHVTNIPVYVQGPPVCPETNTAGVHATFSGNYQYSSQVTDKS